jgi:hypothetical protein
MSTPNATGILLDGIVTALADRSYLTQEQKQERAGDIWALIETFHPQDPLQIMLIGQALLFNDLLADGARDVLHGMVDTLKLRAVSNVNALNRSLHQNLSMFLRLRDKSAPVANESAHQAAAPPEPKPEEATPPPKEEASWIDEPFTTWVVETPAEAFARETAERESLAEFDQPPPRSPTRPLVTPEMMERSAVPELIGTS